MTSALAELRAAAATPDERAFATISERTHVRFSLAPGYYEWATVPDLEMQLTRLAKLLFVARMKEYYQARSRDFSMEVTKESPPVSARDHEYVRARAALAVEGVAAGGAVRITTLGMESWAVRLAPEVKQRLDEQAFCDAVSDAATELVTLQFAGVKALKREIYGSQ
jgi:hypothetical protein